MLKSPSFNKDQIKLLIDTGADLNIIKINALKNDTEINEKEKIYLKGINEKIVSTIGKTELDLIIDNKAFETEFYVVNEIFPITGDGIIGNKFLVDNHAIIDVANNTITINESKIKNDNDICFTLQPRSETIVEISIDDKDMNNKNILINKQELLPDVYCTNIYNKVIKMTKTVIE